MSEKQLAGINEGNIDIVIRKLQDDLDKLLSKFNQLDIIVDSTSSFFESTYADTFRTNYKVYRDNYQIIKNNILSYIDDLVAVKANYKKFAIDASTQISQYAKTRFTDNEGR